MKMRIARIVVGALLAGCFASTAFGLPTEKLGVRNLRGYGESAAVRTGNEVVVAAESSAKAFLWAARYDHVYAAHRVRPGVYRLPGGGWTQLSVQDKTFRVVYSETEPAEAFAGTLPAVPFYLNAWDDHAFRFYYWPGQAPWNWQTRVGTPWEKYDCEPEFAWAEQQGRAGVVLWANGHRCDTAYGCDDEYQWTWARKLGEKHGLPIVLNTNGGVPMWVADAFREENALKAPGYVGSYHSVGEAGQAGEGFVSWASRDGRQAVLDVLARVLQKNNTENVIDFLEPHGELAHGDFTVYLEHGPLVDESYRAFLKERYGTPEAVARRWQRPSIHAWSDITLPTIAEFAGLGRESVDLTGAWQYRLQSETNGWTGVVRQMPGHDLALFLPDKPAVFRRSFTMPSLPRAGTRTWLYVWDLSKRLGDRVVARLNGQTVADEACRHATNHWMVREVTGTVRPDTTNEIVLEVSNGKCMYKVYLTHEEPKSYPYFGEGKNAEWVDWCLWQQASRTAAVRQGLETLRAVEPDKGVVAMAPDSYFTPMRELAAEFGTRFHNTGYMAAFWCEMLPMLMRSKNLPFTLEPGGPASTRQDFKRMTNFYMSEGVNAIHYFIHIGDVFWKDEIRLEFERRLPALQMMGRYAQPDNEIAEVMDSTREMILGYPWRRDVASAYPSGYMDWRFPAVFGDLFQMDAVTPVDFATGAASRYRFLLDSNTTMLTDEDVAGIANYVRAGGTYVAMFQSGRHAPLHPDRWILSDLAGVETVKTGDYALVPNARGVPELTVRSGFARVDPGPHAASLSAGAVTALKGARGDGTSFKPLVPDVQVLAKWEDGTAAVTLRPLGKGRLIMFGIRPHSIYEGWEYRYLEQLLLACGAKAKTFSAKCGRGMGRQYLTTDGLYDVFYADAGDRAGPYELSFRDGKARALTNVLDGSPVPLKGELGADDFVMATSPHGDDAGAAWHWVKNQFGWWQGRVEAKAPVSRAAKQKLDDLLYLNDGWSVNGRFRKLEPWVVGIDVASNETDFVCTRSFTVPAAWREGAIELWGVGGYADMFSNAPYSVLLDGQEVRSRVHRGLCGLVLPVKAGGMHTLELSLKGDVHPRVRGFMGPIYLVRRESPQAVLDLAGEWEALVGFADAAPRTVALPGTYENVLTFRRMV